MSPEWIPLLFAAALIAVLLLMLRSREQSRRVTINSSCKENQLLATQPRQSVGEASTYQLIQIFEFKIYDTLKV